jgi:serine protease DegS
MSDAWKVAGFVGRSITVGLAAAFVVVLIRPDLIRAPESRAATAVSSYADAVLASSPAVANVYTERTLNAVDGRSDVTLRGRALGSAVVLSRDGYLVTNWHVIRDADEIRVQLADGRVAVPALVGADPETELALLRVDLPDMPAIELGRSDGLRVGEVVLAIGNSLGLSQTVTMGIVSATGRGPLGVTTFADFIQTDAAINIGNSGGALVNTSGQLVGINTAVISSSVGDQAPPEGIGFAIPVNLVRGVMAQLIEHGRVIRGYLDVETTNLPARDARSFGIEDGAAVLLEVVNGPAAAAGLLPGDALTHINDTRVYSQEQAMTIVASQQPGERIRIRVTRPNGETITTEAVLEERPLRAGS